MIKSVFPNGEIDVVRDTKRVYSLANEKLTMDECDSVAIFCERFLWHPCQ